MGRRARQIVDRKFTMNALLKRLCDAVENGVQERSPELAASPIQPA
jgi:hypothetical protein